MPVQNPSMNQRASPNLAPVPHLGPYRAAHNLQQALGLAVSRAAKRRHIHHCNPPVLKRNPIYQYGPQFATAPRPGRPAAASSASLPSHRDFLPNIPLR